MLPLVVLYSCGGAIKTQSSGKAGRPYVEFYMQPGVTQYFIGPLLFEGDDDRSMAIDYTLRDSTHSVSEVAMNFSLLSEEMVKTPDSLVYYLNSQRSFVVQPPFDRFYVEKDKLITHRYGSFVPYEQIKGLFIEDASVSVEFWTEGKQMAFELKRSSQKTRRAVEETLIPQIEFTKNLD